MMIDDHRFSRFSREPSVEVMTSAAQSAVWLPLFDDLADPRVVATLAAEAEECGWQGFFVWDKLTWASPILSVTDPWIALAAAAAATEVLRIGPMVTPVPRRRPSKLARETVALDRLSDGRLTLGVGIGSDAFGSEFERTGEQVNERLRGEMLDETLSILTAAWRGAPVSHHERHYQVDDIAFLPEPTQRPGIPIWTAGYAGRTRPLRRAARCDGYFPVELEDADQLAETLDTLHALRPKVSDRFDVAVPLPPDHDPTPYTTAGATWILTEFEPHRIPIDYVRGVIRDGPAMLRLGEQAS
ncbi:MAG: LLM class flavin-dependent oxidoreductase [Nocardioides sp.]